MPTGFWTKCLPKNSAQNISLKCQILAAYLTLSETEALTGIQPILLHMQVPILPWVRDTTQQRLGMATEASLLK